MFRSIETTDKAQKKRLAYAKAIYAIAVIVPAVYICKFNFQYLVADYNALLLSLWWALIIIPPFLLHTGKNHVYAGIALCLLTQSILTAFLYLCGGVESPGLFWLTVTPMMTAILFGQKGALAGYALVIITMAVFWYLKLNNLGPNVVAQYGNYAFEETYNILIFLFFSSFTTHLYIRDEQRFARRLQEKNTNIENLLRVLLHDVANTLSSMTYNLLKARSDSEFTPANSELEKMERAVDDLNNLLAQVRHLKSAKDGKVDMLIRPVPISQVVTDVFDKIEFLASQKGVHIALDLSLDKIQVNGEKTILGNIVLLNLLSNAVKFSHPGDRIDLRVYSQSSAAVIEIQDYGIGMPQPLIEQIFDINSQTTRKGTHGEKGTGYGLPLVKEYLEMMGGGIHVTSREESQLDHPRGTKVTLTLPLAH